MLKKHSKITNNIKNYVLNRKRKNSDISCRKLADDVSSKFDIIISKSSINAILKSARLSSPVGRSVNAVFRPSVETAGAGYCFLYGANLLLGVSRILASVVRKQYPLIRIKHETLETLSEAWIMARAIYNVSLDKIENYHKNEMWYVVGKKASKGLLRRFRDTFKLLQPISFQVVSELFHTLQDVCYLRMHLADNSTYMLDGQFRSVWKDKTPPVDFSTTIDIANSYINSIFSSNSPVVIFNARPQVILGEEISNLVFSFDGSSASQRIRKIDIVSHNNNVIKEIQFVIPERRRFAIGVWPWQYKAISDLEKQSATGKIILEPIGREFYFVEKEVKFVQHIHNIDVMLRIIALKFNREGPARIAILTNLDAEEWDTRMVAEHYLRRWPDPEAGHKLFLTATNNPEYVEEFISGEKLFSLAKKLQNDQDADVFFAHLVDLLSEFSKRCFFPPTCSSWSLLKMRELIFKLKGSIKMDISDNVLYNILKLNTLEQKDFLDFACVKFNEAQIIDASGRKLWAAPATL